MGFGIASAFPWQIHIPMFLLAIESDIPEMQVFPNTGSPFATYITMFCL